MNIVFIIPTGIGAEIGGHAGDGNAVAKLFASCCDNFITHPNVVNASDINEMTENTWYVEGSILDRFLEGKIKLEKPKSNKIICAVNSPVQIETIDAVSAGRVTLGADIKILELKTPLKMISEIKDDIATGTVTGWKELVKQVKDLDFDALAITSLIDVKTNVVLNYFKNGGVNPWGGIEAKTSKLIANALNKPVAHAPITEETAVIKTYRGLVDPRISAEMVSVCYLHCVLKGLHKAPRPSNKGLSYKDIDVMISPDEIYGKPHIACNKNHIPIIYVKENKTSVCRPIGYTKNDVIVGNYLEAVGVVQSLKIGITIESVRRPIKETEIIK